MAAIWSASAKLPTPAPRVAPAAFTAGKPASRRIWAFALAASLLAAAALAFMLRGTASGEGSETVAFVTERSEPRQFALPDGSRVMLDAQSRVELTFSQSERRIHLRSGRARFSVAHEARPFIVQAGADEIVATGTVFDVSLLRDRLSVALLQGAVEVRQGLGNNARSVTRLTPGNRLILDGRAAPYSLRVGPRDSAWANRMIEFEDVPLAEAVEMANRYSETQIRIGDEAAGTLRVTGAYRAGDAAGLARGLAAAFGLRVSTDPDGHLRLASRPQAR
ncbi:MAG TPA: FecR domain-containing protein [Allosphingosinicella sp.]|nr:FecR domain-containing protein [Allosphingosinicella sp.]